MSSYLRLVATFYMRCHKANINRIIKKRRKQLEEGGEAPPSPDSVNTPNPIRPGNPASNLSVNTQRPLTPVPPPFLTPRATPSSSRWAGLAVNTPAKTRTRVQRRLGKIIANEVASLRGRLDIEADRITVSLVGIKGVAEKWMIPRSAYRSFIGVSYESILELGEADLRNKGLAAFDKMPYEDRVLLFAPLLAMMGDFAAMSAWLRGTDFIVENDKVKNEKKSKNVRSISMAVGQGLSNSERTTPTAAAEPTQMVRSASMADLQQMSPRKQRGWNNGDLRLPSNLKSEQFRIS
ncbi:hypothetical protein TrLO_g1697 [Triparma laevis f. longispina]|nr:hypothetical protein TrLO_g1697 [Triparma laevis f. longispina]